MQWAEMVGPEGTRQRFAVFPGPLRNGEGQVVGAVNLLLDPAGLPAPEPQLGQGGAEPGFLLFEALRDGSGRVEDFVLRRASGVAAWLPARWEAGLPGRTLSGLLSGDAAEAARLVAEYAAALREGLPRPGTWPAPVPPGGRCRLVPAGECIALLFEPEGLPSESGAATASGQDEVTGLRGRDGFMRMLEDSLDAAGEHIVTALLLISLGGMQQARASLGAAASDMLLRHAASRLAHVVRSGDVLARIGDATFAVLMAPGADAAAGTVLAGRIGRTLGRPFGLDGVTVLLDVAVGVALAPHDGATAETLVQGAELAARRARGAGRGGRSAAQAEG
jgi:diguanylate cyclase (GGDEF)-like protein